VLPAAERTASDQREERNFWSYARGDEKMRRSKFKCACKMRKWNRGRAQRQNKSKLVLKRINKGFHELKKIKLITFLWMELT